MTTPKPALRPTEFHVLLALSDRPLHGYALSQRIELESEGRVRMLPGNLYAVLRRLVQGGLVAETDDRPEGDREDTRRRYFMLTGAGRDLLFEEARRLAKTAELATARLRESAALDGEATP